MRLANSKMYLFAAVLAAATGARAAPEGAPGQPAAALQPAAAASAPAGESRSHKAGSIAIGHDLPQGSESLKDLEALQRQAYFLELRNKIKDMSALPSQTGLPASAPAGAAAQRSAQDPRGTVLPLMPAPAFMPRLSIGAVGVDEQPAARVQSVIVMSARSRADVVVNGSVVTVKEGDDVGNGWKVTSIKPGAVRAEKVVTLTRPDPSFIAPAPTRIGKKAAATPAAPPMVPMVPYEKTLTAVLRPADKPAASEDTLAPVAPAVLTGIPPLPAGLRRVDSTAVPAAMPLGTGFIPQAAATELGAAVTR
jgi:type IV pilus biogenesis protein PilP